MIKSVLNKKFKLGKYIKCRSGWMWYLKDKPNRTIKVTKDSENENLVFDFNKILSYLKQINSPSIVKIYEFGSFDIKDEPYCYHIMEKLFPLPNTQDKIWIERILQEYYQRNDIPWFCSNDIQNFLYKLREIKYKYKDLHYENIMLNSYGKLKLIDLESFL